MLFEYNFEDDHQDFYDITGYVNQAIQESNVQSGIAIVYTPHTTSSIAINENYDPDVKTDLIYALNKVFADDPKFQHIEGNSAAHLKAITVGHDANIIIENGKALLGRWQGVFFVEFDPPRSRHFYIKIVSD